MWSKKRTIIGIALLSVIIGTAVLTAACGSSSGIGPVKETVITPQITADTYSISVSEVETNINNQFKMSTANGSKYFAAYTLDGQIYVRATMCVPCQGTSFTLDNDILVCDNCGTRFNGKTGAGISGVPACQSYPKAAVPFQITDGNIVMSSADLVTAFNNTLKPGLP